MLTGRDILVLALLASDKFERWTVRGLAEDTGLPSATMHRSLRRLNEAGVLVTPQQRGIHPWVAPVRVHDLFVYAVRPNFPPVYLGDRMLGLPAAWHASPLRELTTSSGEQPIPVVWPYDKGTMVGTGIQPIDAAVPRIASEHPEPGGPGQLLALIDALRYGHGPRITGLATEKIAEFVGAPRREHRAA